MTQGMWIFFALVFGAAFLLMQGMAIPVFSESRKMRKRIQARLQNVGNAHVSRELNSLLRDKYLKSLSPAEQKLEALPGMEWLASMIEQAGRSTPAYRVVLSAIVLGITAAFIVWLLSHIWVIALGAGLVGGVAPFMAIMRARANRFAKFEEQMPEAIDLIQRALKAGHPFNQCLSLIAEDMEEPIAGEFELTFSDMSYGSDARQALLSLLERMPSVSVMALVTAVIVQRETGGNLADNLGRISSVIRGRFKFQRKVKTLTAEGRLSGWILAMMPLTLFGVLWLMHPEYVARLTSHPKGPTLIEGAVVLGCIGILWIRNLVRIEV